MQENFDFFGKQALIYSDGKIPAYSDDLTKTSLFKEVLNKYISHLENKKSSLLNIFPSEIDKEEALILMQKLSRYNKTYILEKNPELKNYFSDEYLLLQFVENFYNFWREYERFFICYSNSDYIFPHSQRAPSTFNKTIEQLNELTRELYRNICENISGKQLSIYRQLHAAAQVGLIVVKEKNNLPPPYDKLSDVNFIKQVLIEPPLIIDPPLNKRSGEFSKIEKNPIDFVSKLNKRDWVCYPAQVGELVIHIYFHNQYIGLGTALSNLFELATQDQLEKKPDAIYLFGIKPEEAKEISEESTVFYDDKENNIFVASVPLGDNFAYFGYLKKMVLTLHNSIMMKRKIFPVHGAMVRIKTKNDKEANLLIMGDTGAGKSEALEAFRTLGDEYISEITVIFDDMGSLQVIDGKLKAFGTETGAFVRLDDLQPGFAFGNIDRSIIMSPQKINARAVLPITTIEEVLKGHKIDYFLYANNYEQISKEKPVIKQFSTAKEAIEVFREGKSMKKGTTTDVGITKTYFVNIFGPVQYKELHDELVDFYFDKLFEENVFVGELRTQLGIDGYETKGPEEAAKALIDLIAKKE